MFRLYLDQSKIIFNWWNYVLLSNQICRFNDGLCGFDFFPPKTRLAAIPSKSSHGTSNYDKEPSKLLHSLILNDLLPYTVQLCYHELDWTVLKARYSSFWDIKDKKLWKISGWDLLYFFTLSLCSIDTQVLNDKGLSHVELQYLITFNFANALQLFFHIFFCFHFFAWFQVCLNTSNCSVMNIVKQHLI